MDEERLAKNERIRISCKATKLRRKQQLCRVYHVKIDFSHLNRYKQKAIKMLFVEAKWLYNDVLTFTNTRDINEYDYKVTEVHVLDKNKKPVMRTLEYLGSQMKQSVIQGLKFSLKSLKATKRSGRKIGQLKYKSDYNSINLQQHGITYKFHDNKHVKIQNIEVVKIRGANQFINIPGLEFANAKLMNLPDGYYYQQTP